MNVNEWVLKQMEMHQIWNCRELYMLLTCWFVQNCWWIKWIRFDSTRAYTKDVSTQPNFTCHLLKIMLFKVKRQESSLAWLWKCKNNHWLDIVTCVWSLAWHWNLRSNHFIWGAWRGKQLHHIVAKKNWGAWRDKQLHHLVAL